MDECKPLGGGEAGRGGVRAGRGGRWGGRHAGRGRGQRRRQGTGQDPPCRHRGRAVQVDPINPTLESASNQALEGTI